MAQDYRKITLCKKEAAIALDAHRRAAPDFLPSGEILSIMPRNQDEILVTIKMLYGKNVHECVFEFKTADFCPVLKQFCSENNILLPTQGKRQIFCDENCISLIIIEEI